MNEKNQIFISYNHQDEEFVDKLMIDLTLANLNAVYDKWILKAGDSIIEKITESIEFSSYFIVVISSNSINSNWIKRELTIALSAEISTKTIKVIPVRIDNCTLPFLLTDKLYVDFSNWYYEGVTKLISTLNPNFKNWRDKYSETSKNKFKKLKSLKVSLDNEDYDAFIEIIEKNELFLLPFLRHFIMSSSGSNVIKSNSYVNTPFNFDFIAINNSYMGHEITLIKFMDLDVKKKTIVELKEIISLAEETLNFYRLNKKEFLKKVIYQSSKMSFSSLFHSHGTSIDIKIVFGRRKDYKKKDSKFGIFFRKNNNDTEVYSKFRAEVFENTNREIEIVSYDRVLEQIESSMDYFQD